MNDTSHEPVQIPTPDEAPEALEGELLPKDLASPVVEFNRTIKGLGALRVHIKTAIYDCSTSEGDKVAREDRRMCVKLRGALKDAHAEAKADILARGRVFDGEKNRITKIIEDLEAIPDAAIRAQEKIDDATKEERRKAEAERLAKIDREISRIANLPVTYVAAPAPVLRGVIQSLAANRLEQFDTLHVLRAQEAKDASLETLNELLKQRVSDDEARAEAERQRVENERIAAEQRESARVALEQAEAERAEADRIAREAREKADAEAAAKRTEDDRLAKIERELKAEAQRQADELAALERAWEDAHTEDAQREQQKRLDADRAEVERQQAESREERERVANEQREREERIAREGYEREEAERIRDEQERIEKASLISAAADGAELLSEVGQGDHLVTRTLRAALAREGVVAKGRRRADKRKTAEVVS